MSLASIIVLCIEIILILLALDINIPNKKKGGK